MSYLDCREFFREVREIREVSDFLNSLNSLNSLPHSRTILASEWWIYNAAIKPNAIAVATKCKGRRLKMGACSQIFKLALWRA